MVRQRVPAAAVAAAGVLASCGAPAAPGQPAPTPAVTSRCTLAATGGLEQVTILAPGPLGTMPRTYELHVPAGAGATGPVPLLVSLHGLGATGGIQDALTGWSAFADDRARAGAPFIAAFPDGVGTLWLWGLQDSYDVTFLFDVIAGLRSSGCVDPSAIYVDGWSEGAYMAQRMACAASGGGVTLAAVHSYAGGDPALPGPCRPSREVPLLLSNGLDDVLIDPLRLGFPDFEAWGRRYSCEAPAAPYTAAQELGGCGDGTPVAWWPLSGLGHLSWSCPADRFWHNRGIWGFLTRRVAPADTVCR